MVSVIAGGPSKNTSSGARVADALRVESDFVAPPFLFPRLAWYIIQYHGRELFSLT